MYKMRKKILMLLVAMLLSAALFACNPSVDEEPVVKDNISLPIQILGSRCSWDTFITIFAEPQCKLFNPFDTFSFGTIEKPRNQSIGVAYSTVYHYYKNGLSREFETYSLDSDMNVVLPGYMMENSTMTDKLRDRVFATASVSSLVKATPMPSNHLQECISFGVCRYDNDERTSDSFLNKNTWGYEGHVSLDGFEFDYFNDDYVPKGRPNEGVRSMLGYKYLAEMSTEHSVCKSISVYEKDGSNVKNILHFMQIEERVTDTLKYVYRLKLLMLGVRKGFSSCIGVELKESGTAAFEQFADAVDLAVTPFLADIYEKFMGEPVTIH